MAFTKKVKTTKTKAAPEASLPEKSGSAAASVDLGPIQHVDNVIEWEQSDDISKLAAALVSFRREAKNPEKDKQGYNYRYTTLDNIIVTTQPLLAKNGLAVLQHPVSDGKGGVGVATMLVHSSGQFVRSRYILPTPLLSGQINAAQEAGAAITYARRYGINAILNLASDEDTDAAGLAEAGSKFKKKK
jgi:hypothetical protein